MKHNKQTLNKLFICEFQCLSPENVTKIQVLRLYMAEVGCDAAAVPLVVLGGAWVALGCYRCWTPTGQLQAGTMPEVGCGAEVGYGSGWKCSGWLLGAGASVHWEGTGWLWTSCWCCGVAAESLLWCARPYWFKGVNFKQSTSKNLNFLMYQSTAVSKEQGKCTMVELYSTMHF